MNPLLQCDDEMMRSDFYFYGFIACMVYSVLALTATIVYVVIYRQHFALVFRKKKKLRSGICEKQPSFSEKQPNVSEKQPGASEKQPSASEKQPNGSEQQPSADVNR
uniref:G_PROTEIN_RECEP_F1_2 domain-containing protein n=1 Tax=Steinernema glaseri TaxID=37863 RepID=A0A1I7ZLK8_9BILA